MVKQIEKKIDLRGVTKDTSVNDIEGLFKELEDYAEGSRKNLRDVFCINDSVGSSQINSDKRMKLKDSDYENAMVFFLINKKN